VSAGSEHGSLKAIFYALGANTGIAIAKGFAAWYTNSGAMLAEAIHSTADCANQGLLLLGLKRAKRAPSESHPLGYGKAIYFWSFLVALLLFSMGGIFSIYEGVHKLAHPEMPESPWIAVAVLVVSIVLEYFSLRGALAEINKVRGAQTLFRWFRGSRQSELIVVFGEDLAALLGLALALLAVLATIVTGNPVFDALGTIAIGTVLILVAIGVGIEVKSLLIGESADPALEAEIEQVLLANGRVTRVFNMITLQLGTDVMLSVKAELAGCRTADELIEAINASELELRQRFPQLRWIFFEPDRHD
jgi:cation diffusion facilitator family transporter